ncbi:hypothetical protein [Sphingomonas sanguinis]|uniref:hypothetical protein n=1 Tax=Sphingomonas sanguinis TaxID=33051 RepID=UPI00214C6DF2|nr:hypothetical protein [Sphingomonas sanguinis]
MTNGQSGRRIRRYRNAILLTSILTVAAPSAAWAGPGDADPQTGFAKDGDITVTGRRDKEGAPTETQVGAFRNQSLLDTPLTVTVIDRNLLHAQDARGLDDALRNVAASPSRATAR